VNKYPLLGLHYWLENCQFRDSISGFVFVWLLFTVALPVIHGYGVAVASDKFLDQNETESSMLLSNPGKQILNEEQIYIITIIASPSARIFVSGMPAGMRWDEVNRQFHFRPDFIQGGNSWQISMEADDGVTTSTEVFEVMVNNNIQPPWPEIVGTEDLTGLTKLNMRQITDNFLDSPGYAGREFMANLAIPTAASATNLLPVRIDLHGFGGSPGTVGRAGFFGIAPHDVNNTWWTGYNEDLPAGPVTGGINPNYTQRRVMHLLSYLMESCPGLAGGCPGIDPQRISISGQSMGGTGSFFLAINYGYHFSDINARLGGTTPYFLTGGQQDMLTNLWGAESLGLLNDRGVNTWQGFDSSRAALNNYFFRNLHFSTISGQNDLVIHFNAMAGASPVTDRTFFSVLQEEGIGHFSVWDQRAHTVSDPDLPGIWWEPLDEASFFRRDLAFPAFSNGSADDDEGKADGTGGFTGALRGAKNRYMRWDSDNIIDTRELLSIPIRVDIDTTGTTPPTAGFPPLDNEYYGLLPITSDVTVRRIQKFQVLPEETIIWEYNGSTGIVNANSDGSVTVPNLTMVPTFTVLTLQREIEPVEPSIISQPVSQAVAEGSPVTFSIAADGSVPLGFQWYRDNVLIDGATNASYTIGQVSMNDNGMAFYCEATNSLGSDVSNEALLTVIADTTVPLIDRAIAVTETQIDIVFSEAVTVSSAETLANYQIDQGIQVLAVSLNADNKTVRLQTDTLDSNTIYTVTINNIQDVSAAANQIAAQSSIEIVFAPVLTFDDGLLPLGWTPLTVSRWSVVDDNGNNALFLNTTSYPPLSGNRLGEYIVSPDSYADFTLTVEAKSNESAGNTNADYALVFGFVDNQNYFYMLFNRTLSNTQLFKVDGGVRELIGTATAGSIVDDAYHEIEVRRTGNSIEVRSDGGLVLAAEDSTFPSGKLGLGSFNDSAYFDDIRITGGGSGLVDLIFANTFEN